MTKHLTAPSNTGINLSAIEATVFLGFAISLPLFEGPKNILIICSLALFLYRYVKFPNTLKRTALDNYIVMFFVLSAIASIGAAYNGYEVRKLHDIFRLTLVGYVFLKTPLSSQNLQIVLLALIGSAFIASLQSYYNIYSGINRTFSLASVGHINHSAIYLLLILGLSLPLLLNKSSFLKGRIWKVFFMGVSLFFILTLFYTNSRATFIGFCLVFLLCLMADYITTKRLNFLFVGFALICLCGFLMSPSKIMGKFQYHTKTLLSETKLTTRQKIWITSLAAWKKEPLFGVGFGNFSIITPEKMKALYSDNPQKLPAADTTSYNSSHAHNRYVNTLLEGGLIGFSGLLAFLFGAASLLWKNFKRAIEQPDPQNTMYWLIGANTFITIAIVGVFNTTLHHEHGLLAMILIAISCGYFSHTDATKTQHK